MIDRVIRAAAALMLLPASVSAQQLADPAAAFGARESIQSLALSPDGRRIAYVAPNRDQSSSLYIVDLSSPTPRRIAYSEGEQRLTGCDFASNERLICSMYAIREVGGVLVPTTRLLAVGADGRSTVELGERNTTTQLYFRASSGSVIDYLPGEENAVLMQQVFIPETQTGRLMGRTGDGLGVVRVDTNTRRSTGVEAPRPSAIGYVTDGRGRVRLMALQTREGTGQDSSQISFLYRRAGRNDWEELGTYDLGTEQGLDPVAVDPQLDVAYAFTNLNGRQALYRISLDGTMRRELVASHDLVDVDGLLRIGRSNRVVGASYATERRESVYFDPELRSLAERLRRTLPNLPLINFAGASEDESKLLIWAGSDNDAGRYYIYDRNARALTPIAPVRPELENLALATVRPVTYRAADGTQIPAYLTLPPHATGRGLPAVVMPHGGPGARDEWGFDWLAQFFANRGYAVLQPNFRGSAGYGEAWFRNNGFRSWRTAVGDVNDAGRWLVSEGIADPAKLGIFGWSYGGYAALQSGVLEPNLFKAIVAVAPVTDLDIARNEWRGFSNSANVRDFFGTGPHIREGSPAQNAGNIRAPVLMFHGTYDRNVGIRQARLMDERLRAAGRESELVVFRGLDHQLDDSAARADLLRRSDVFFRRAMGIPQEGGSTPPPPPVSNNP